MISVLFGLYLSCLVIFGFVCVWYWCSDAFLLLSCCLAFSSKAALIALGYEEVALDDFWQTFLQELDALPNMEMGQLEVS